MTIFYITQLISKKNVRTFIFLRYINLSTPGTWSKEGRDSCLLHCNHRGTGDLGGSL